MSEPARRMNHAAEVEGFLDTLFEGQEGFVYTPTKNPNTGHWQTYFFTWPAQRSDIVTHIMDASKTKEAYLSPSLFNAPDAKRNNWKGSNYVWIEFDGNAPKALPKGVPDPTIRVQSSTEGHEHWYWRLNEFESNQDVVQGLSKQLTYTLSADKSGWDANQVLRPPGTLHHDSKRRVRLLKAENRTVSLTDFVGLIEAPPDVVVNTNLSSLPDVADVVSKYKFPTDARDLFRKSTQPVGSRSQAMMRMAFHCVEMGMTNEEAYSILYNCDERWGKYKNRTPENRAKVLVGMITHARNEKGIQAEIRLNDYEPMYTVSELLALDFSKIDWMFKDVLTENSFSILAGDPGVGKTTMAMQLGFSVANAKPFLNWDYGLQDGGQNVGLFSYEMDGRQSGHFIRTMLSGYSKQEETIIRERVFVRPTGYAVNLDRPEEQQKVLDYVDKHELKFLVFDSLKAINALEEKKFDVIMRFFSKELRAERQCTILAIHHNRKPSAEGYKTEQTLADLYGDVFIQAGATHVLGLRVKGKKIEVANTKNRLAPMKDPFKIVRGDHMIFKLADGKEEETDDNSIPNVGPFGPSISKPGSSM